MASVAIIGSGIAGMGCAHFLHRHFDVTLGDYVKARRYGDDFFNLYLVPMSSAVW